MLLFCSSSCLLCFQVKKGGGLSFNSTLPLTKCSEKLVQLILHEYSILIDHHEFIILILPHKHAVFFKLLSLV